MTEGPADTHLFTRGLEEVMELSVSLTAHVSAEEPEEKDGNEFSPAAGEMSESTGG